MLLLELLTITGGWAAISGFFPNVFSYQYLFATCVANFVSYCVIVSAVCHVQKLSILWDFINYIFYTSGLFFNCFCWTVLTWFISCSGSTFPNWGEADVQQDSWARGGRLFVTFSCCNCSLLLWYGAHSVMCSAGYIIPLCCCCKCSVAVANGGRIF